MKKIVLFAAFVAAGAAFTSCSSEEEIAQAPEVQAPATEVTEDEGTPFGVEAFDASTRATLYNANAWDGSNDTYVSNMKIYGVQKYKDYSGTDQKNVWMDNVVFTRGSKDASWAVARASDGSTLPSLKWPTKIGNDSKITLDGAEDEEDANKTAVSAIPSTFYAITDNAIGTDANNPINGVNAWMSTEGKFSFSFPTLSAKLPHIAVISGTGYLDDDESEDDQYYQDPVSYADASKMGDLMVATTTAKESETDKGVLPLSFSHTLAGFAVKLIFRNDGVNDSEGSCKIHYIKVMGLKTSGDYTIGASTPWSNVANETCYYKSFATPVEISADAEATTSADAAFQWLVNKEDPWMVIPQTTTPWDGAVCGSGEYITTGKAYIVLGITDDQDTENVEVFLPLGTEFKAGTNKTLRIDLGTFRDLYADQESDDVADYYFAPALGGGGARGFEFIDE